MATDLGFTTDVRIGASIATMEDVKVEPHVEFLDAGGGVEKVVCGEVKAVGYPRCRWTYPDRRLTGEQYYQLRSLVENDMSADVYIDIPTNQINVLTYEPVVATYSGVLNWPEEGVRRTIYNQWEIEDGILFTNLVPA